MAVVCKECKGRGQTKATRTEMEKYKDGKRTRLRTTALGSGCPVCGGTGSVVST